MTDQKLADELEKALTDEVYDGGIGALDADQFRELVRTLAVTAAEVVENAHTPTDDEREVMRRIIAEGSYSRSRDDLPYQDVADRLVAAGFGFRRTEVPEPSRDPGWSHPEAVYSPEVFMAIQGLLNEARGEPMHALRLAVSRNLSEPQGEPSDEQESEFQCGNCGAGIPDDHIGPHPSDAQVKAAARTLNLNGWTCDEGAHEPGNYDECEDCQRCCDGLARAALHAAGEVGR